MTTLAYEARPSFIDDRPTKPSDIAAAIRRTAQERGVQFYVDRAIGDPILTVRVTFQPGDARGYMQAEAACQSVLRYLPRTRPGTTWGTDSGSVGGHVGLTNGYCELHFAGGDKRVLKALS